VLPRKKLVEKRRNGLRRNERRPREKISERRVYC
jgi:hypothetical protein